MPGTTTNAPRSAHHDLPIGPQHKSVPSDLWGRTIGQAVAGNPRLHDFATPLLTIDSGVLTAMINRAIAGDAPGTWSWRHTARPRWRPHCGPGCSSTAQPR